MPYQVQQMIERKEHPVCIGRDDPVSAALALMIEHNYSQLPVVETIANADFPRGMITYESILRGVRSFGAQIGNLRVRDVMVAPPTCDCETDLFDNGGREIRNALAHFRGDLTPEQRDRLKFGVEWLSGRQDEYEAKQGKRAEESPTEVARRYPVQAREPSDRRVRQYE